MERYLRRAITYKLCSYKLIISWIKLPNATQPIGKAIKPQADCALWPIKVSSLASLEIFYRNTVPHVHANIGLLQLLLLLLLLMGDHEITGKRH